MFYTTQKATDLVLTHVHNAYHHLLLASVVGSLTLLGLVLIYLTDMHDLIGTCALGGLLIVGFSLFYARYQIGRAKALIRKHQLDLTIPSMLRELWGKTVL